MTSSNSSTVNDRTTTRLYQMEELFDQERRATLADVHGKLLDARKKARWGRRDGLTDAAELVARMLTEADR